MPTVKASTLPALGAATLCLAVACGPSKDSDPETIPPAQPTTQNQESWEETPRPETGEPPGSEPDPYGGAAQAGGGDVSEDDVEAFSRAYLEVMNIQRAYGSRLESAGSQDEVQALQVEAKNEMEQAIEGQGMTMAEFEELGQALNTDDELRQRVETKLQELQTGAAPE